jgi:hypothetical protein
MEIDWETDQTWKRVFEPKNAVDTTKTTKTKTKTNTDTNNSDDDQDNARTPTNAKCLIDTSVFGDI